MATWEFKGRELVNCSCDYGCNCQFNGLPDKGHCHAVAAIQIDEGHHHDTRLDGLRLGAIFKWPGPIPEGLELDHLCKNGKCVNPAHLEPVTHAENIRRSRLAKLTWNDVDFIRASPIGSKDLAARFGVSRRTINDVRSGHTWV